MPMQKKKCTHHPQTGAVTKKQAITTIIIQTN